MLEITAETRAGDDRAVKQAWAFCHAVLPEVSRTFALTIPVLPEPLVDPVCCAYLLCRIADTIEDRSDLADQERDELFDLFARAVDRPEAQPHFSRAWPPPRVADSAADHRLTTHLGEVLLAFGTLDRRQRRLIRECVREMIAGMRTMVRSPNRDRGGPVFICSDIEELERYCHFVAGTVGVMLTGIFATVLPASATFAADPRRLEQGRRFGIGLQLTNVLKDHRADRQRGVSFVPAAWVDPVTGQLGSQHRRRLFERALSHLDQAHDYTLALPPTPPGLRLFCLWALWMALATLREVARDRERPPKITRDEVARIVAFTRAHVAQDVALERQFAGYRAGVEAAL